MKVRISYGSAIKLGLLNKKIDCLPTTIYLMTVGACTGRCLFCVQAGGSASQKLSRVTWPESSLDEVLTNLGSERVCLQCLNYRGLFDDIAAIVENIENPISVSAQPFTTGELRLLAEKVERIGISLDCAAERLFKTIKPTYSWDLHWKRLKKAVKIFGDFQVTSHLIVGLGETEEEMVRVMQKLHRMKIIPSLFAFTPLRGTPLESREKVPLRKYRRMQLAYHLITEDISDNFRFTKGEIVDCGVNTEEYRENPHIYTTRGCPQCNRPYYTESPRGPLYNYPYTPSKKEMEEIVAIWKRDPKPF
jgi:biotin synthase